MHWKQHQIHQIYEKHKSCNSAIGGSHDLITGWPIDYMFHLKCGVQAILVPHSLHSILSSSLHSYWQMWVHYSIAFSFSLTYTSLCVVLSTTSEHIESAVLLLYGFVNVLWEAFFHKTYFVFHSLHLVFRFKTWT